MGLFDGGGSGGGSGGSFFSGGSGGGSGFGDGMGGNLFRDSDNTFFGGRSQGGLADLSRNWKRVDPYDFSGQQTKARRAAAEKQIAENEKKMNKLLKQQPKYQTGFNSNINSLNKQQGMIGDVNAGQQYGMAVNSSNQLNQRAFGTEESPWLKLQLQQQQMGQNQASDQMRSANSISTQDAMNQMQMEGGMSPQARERLMKQQNMQNMLGQQNISRQGEMDRLGLRSQEEQNRFQLQQQMPQMQMGLDQYNTNLGQQNRQAQFNKVNNWQQMADAEQARSLQDKQFGYGAKANTWDNRMKAQGAMDENAALLRSGSQTGIQRYGVGGMGL